MPTSVQIKICGLSTPDTLKAAVNAGTAMVGLVFFAKSPRNITLAQAANLAHETRYLSGGQTKTVALTVDADDTFLKQLVDQVKPDILQLHGQETAERAHHISKTYRLPVIKAIGIQSADDIENVKPYKDYVDGFLLDAKPGKTDALPGGRGVTFNWALLEKLTHKHTAGKPALLAGGLTPENVAKAIRLVKKHTCLHGIDVSSGVEAAPGIKEVALIDKFFSNANAALTSVLLENNEPQQKAIR